MQPLRLTLKGFRGIRDGLGRDEITLDLERLADGANLIAIVGANGSGKSTIMDCLTPFMRNLTNLPLKEIGEEFGGRNHATVLSSIRKVEELLKSDPEIAATVRDITSNINSKN